MPITVEIELRGSRALPLGGKQALALQLGQEAAVGRSGDLWCAA